LPDTPALLDEAADFARIVERPVDLDRLRGTA
jgi:hypothetical protein